MKAQLEKSHIRLIDIYGVISEKEINTLEHLGVEYSWSVYSPTKKSEILEAERAKDEKRDIMTRMIGAEIRYCRLGYWVRRAPLGYKNEKVETHHGKRTVLVPHPIESVWMISMFDLVTRGTLSDQQVVDEINASGFRTPTSYKRDRYDKTRITGIKGNNMLTVEGLRTYVKNPVYAGVISELWTRGNPVKGKFNGLVTIETFNKANLGSVEVLELEGQLKVVSRKTGGDVKRKGVNNPDFPFKRVVLCPICRKPLSGSSSRGRAGVYFPYYHCSRDGHYFGVPKKKFDETLFNFVRNVRVNPNKLPNLVKAASEEWEKHKQEKIRNKENNKLRLASLKEEARAATNAMKYTTSSLGIKLMSEELDRIDREVTQVAERIQRAEQEHANEDTVIEEYANYFQDHIDELLLEGYEPEIMASNFAALFEELPSYQELLESRVKLNEMIVFKDSQ
jgi:site-specific DNA recombinase